MDNELFELCKKVYEATKWDGYLDKFTAHGTLLDYEDSTPSVCPLYNSDYLLERLPAKITTKKDTYGLVVTHYTTDGSWIADYCVSGWGQPLSGYREHWLHNGEKAKLTEADTALKALLRLTLALSESGELNK